MGEARRRATVRANQPVLSNADREAIAAAVRTPVLVNGGGNCLVRNYLGLMFLSELGVAAELIKGSMLFRAGPDPLRDVVAFCGAGNAGHGSASGEFLGHVWLRVGDDLVDFTPGDWRREAELIEATGATGDNFGAIQWRAEPEPYHWASYADTTASWRSTGEPKVGGVWYGPWGGGAGTLDIALAKQHSTLLLPSVRARYAELTATREEVTPRAA
jgi:hypothetical protein